MHALYALPEKYAKYHMHQTNTVHQESFTPGNEKITGIFVHGKSVHKPTYFLVGEYTWMLHPY